MQLGLERAGPESLVLDAALDRCNLAAQCFSLGLALGPLGQGLTLVLLGQLLPKPGEPLLRPRDLCHQLLASRCGRALLITQRPC